MTGPLALLLWAVFGYALGSIPSGMVVARLYRNVDLTRTGSGRTGATNVLRTLGPGAAAIVFAGDFFKGALASFIPIVATGDPWAQAAAAFFSVVGHIYSPFLGFKGGRGVTTGLAAAMVVCPWQVAAGLGLGMVLIALTRYVSLGSMVGAVTAGGLMVVTGLQAGQPTWPLLGIAIAGFIVISHRDNIQRLRAGTERKIGRAAASG